MKPLITVLTLGLGLAVTTTVQAALVDCGDEIDGSAIRVIRPFLRNHRS